MALKRVLRYGSATAAIVGVVGVMAYLYESVRHARGSFSVLLEHYVLMALSLYLLLFLGILIVRYGVMIIYSFMDQIGRAHV